MLNLLVQGRGLTEAAVSPGACWVYLNVTTTISTVGILQE